MTVAPPKLGGCTGDEGRLDSEEERLFYKGAGGGFVDG